LKDKNMNTNKIDEIFENWPSPFVTRNQLPKITGGILNAKTLRNLDSLGKGIRGKFTFGDRIVAYPVKDVIEFLKERVQKTRPEGGVE
jgi:hypothetical protein